MPQRSLGALAQAILVPRIIFIEPKLNQKLLMALYYIVAPKEKEKVSHHHLLPNLPKIFYVKVKAIPQTIPTVHVGTEEVDPSTVQADHLNPHREESFHSGADAAIAESETS